MLMFPSRRSSPYIYLAYVKIPFQDYGHSLRRARVHPDRAGTDVCMPICKDSYALLDVLLSLKERSPARFELVAVNLDQKQPGFPADVLARYLESRAVPFRIEVQDTY